MITITFSNPKTELIAFFENLHKTDPEIEITLTITAPEYTIVPERPVLKPAQPSTLKPKTSLTLIECSRCHRKVKPQAMTKSGICKNCNMRNRTPVTTTQTQKEIQKNHEIIWGPEKPIFDDPKPSDTLQMSGRKIA